MEAYLYEYDDEEVDEGENEELEENEEPEIISGKKREALVYPTEIDGMVRLNLSELTQTIIGCRIGEDVTTEYPWVFVKKEIIEDNLDLHAESSEFFPIQREILEYPDETMLVGLAPNTTDDPEFYVCLTGDSRDIVINKIEALRKDQENRVKESVFRAVGEWHELGSSKEIDDSSIKKMRPLLQVEIEVKSEFLNAPIQLVDRNAEEQRDGYIELITTRQSFNSTSKRLVSRGEDTNPIIRDNNTQTSSLKPINSWFQYNYEYEPINTKAYNEEERRVMEKFLTARTDDICDELVMNSAWDIHADDCKKLIRDERDTQVPVPINYTEYQSYHNVKITKNKVINDLCWHPLWTGVAIAAYTDYSKSHNIAEDIADNKIAKACLESNNVLIWSFNDCLMPKLMLECPRQVATISIRPLDGNIVIGGCDNGQIVAWWILGEIEKIEAVTVITSAQAKYKRILRNLMNWMKEPTGSATIHPTVMSSIQTGQRGTITKIIWLPTHTKIGKDGRFIELEENIDIEEVGWQFMTSSEDGTVAFWDLRTQENPENPPKDDKKKATGRSASPLEALNGIFMPTYMLGLKHPEEERPIVITTMSFYVPNLEKVQIEPFSKSKDIDVRKYHKTVISKPADKIQRIILVGTLEGHVGTITWEGFDFSTGLAVNREVATWIWCNRTIHDGPVTHSVRSKYLNDVIVTIGGRAFAVWRDDFSVPVFTKKSAIRYTACSWGTSRPTLIILGRADGTVEIWDLIVKSHEACFTQNISGRIITGIYTHELHLNPQCIAFCDFNGAMRIVTAPSSLLIFEKSDVEWMRGFVDREVDRIQEFQKWQSSSKKSSRTKDRGDRFNKDDKIDSTKENAEEKENKKEITGIDDKTAAQQPRDSIEIAETNWKSSELKRMQRVILEKKGLRADDLDKRLAPVLELRRGAKLKKKKIKDTLRKKDQIFEETVKFSFPEWSQKDANDSSSANDLPIQETHDTISVERTESKDLEQLMPQIDTKDNATSAEKIMKEFKEMSNEFSEQLDKYSIGDTFDLQEMIDEGERKRRSLDVELKKMTKKRPKAFFK